MEVKWLQLWVLHIMPIIYMNFEMTSMAVISSGSGSKCRGPACAIFCMRAKQKRAKSAGLS